MKKPLDPIAIGFRCCWIPFLRAVPYFCQVLIINPAFVPIVIGILLDIRCVALLYVLLTIQQEDITQRRKVFAKTIKQPCDLFLIPWRLCVK